MIDGPMLVAIAALTTRITNVVTTLRFRHRLQEQARPRRILRRRKGREDRGLRA